MGYPYEFAFFGSMRAGIDMEGSDRDVNMQPTQRLPISQLDWMKQVAENLKAMGGLVTKVNECAFKDADTCMRTCLGRACMGACAS